MSAESNDGQKSNLILLDVDFLNDSLSANEIHNEFENNELRSKVVHHHLVIFSGFSSQYEKHGLNKVLLVIIWSHKDPTLFRGGGECWRIKSYAYFFFKKNQNAGNRHVSLCARKK
ncbi:unnamed protein product [Schistosoma curassoni]|nr:unnamed protein product [Schistosoma curassoni]